MTEDDKRNLRVATPQEVQQSLSFALRYDGPRRVRHADDAMAWITADRVLEHLRKSGFVILKRPDTIAPSTSGHRHPNTD